MGVLPPWVDNGALPHLHDAITRAEPNLLSRLNQVKMRPLIAMPMYVIGDLAQKNPLRTQNAVRLSHEGRVHRRASRTWPGNRDRPKSYRAVQRKLREHGIGSALDHIIAIKILALCELSIRNRLGTESAKRFFHPVKVT